MHLLLTIVAFLVIFSLLIVVHECGHFFVAKRMGVKVEEFGFGLPPRIFGKKFGETLYSLNWIPFGGFVRMLGEDGRDKKAAKDPRSFAHKTLWQRTAVVCAGVFMNFLLAWVLLSLGFMIGMQPLIMSEGDFLQAVRDGQVELKEGVVSVEAAQDGEVPPQMVQIPHPLVRTDASGVFLSGDAVLTVDGASVFSVQEWREVARERVGRAVPVTVWRDNATMSLEWTVAAEVTVGEDRSKAYIVEVDPESPAALAGLMPWDRVVGVNGISVLTGEAVVTAVSSSQGLITYEIERDGVLKSFAMERNEQGRVGVMLATVEAVGGVSAYTGGVVSEMVSIADAKYSVWRAPWQALIEMKRIGGISMVMAGRVFGSIFMSGEVPEGVAGPVGIAQMTGLYLQEGFVSLMRFTALLSLSLAVINIFPFPALDGGRQLFIIIEAVRGKPLDSRVEGWIHSVGFLFLMLVIVMVTIKDVVRIF